MANRTAEPASTDVLSLASTEALDAALRELGTMAGTEKKLKAALDKAVEELKAKHAEKLVVEVDGEPVKFADRRSILLDAIERFSTAHRQELIVNGKSRRLNHGEIGFKKARDVVEQLPAPKITEKNPEPKSPLETWVAKLTVQLVTVLAKFTHLAGVAPYVRIQVSVDEASLITAIRDKRVDADGVKRLGYKFVPGGDEFWCKPSAVDAGSVESVE